MNSTLRLLISERALSRADAPYLEDARSSRRYSYAEFAAATENWRAFFERLSLKPGDAVLIDIDDPLSFAVAHLATVAAGLRSIPIDPESSDDALARLSTLVASTSLIISDHADRADRAELSTIPIAGIDPATGAPQGLERVPAARASSLAGGDGSSILFTSGSTGQPKGVELGEQQLLFVANAIAQHNALTEADRGYNPLPLFHVNAQVVGLLATLDAGATLVLDRRFHRTGFWDLLRERDATWLNAVPAILAVLARGGTMDVPPRLRFIRSASAPLPSAVRNALGDTPLIVSYGMTEAASQITATPLGEASPAGSVGKPIGTEVQVRGDDGTELEPLQVGALWIRGAGVIGGYFAARASERFDADGWLTTGDLGQLDEDGFVYLVGRSDDVINRGGEKVYPSEVEDVLLKDQRVREAIVIARDDSILGSVPIAYIIRTDPAADGDQSELIDALAHACMSQLPRSKRPVEINIVSDVPRAATGKVQRSRMRSAVAADSSKTAS